MHQSNTTCSNGQLKPADTKTALDCGGPFAIDTPHL